MFAPPKILSKISAVVASVVMLLGAAGNNQVLRGAHGQHDRAPLFFFVGAGLGRRPGYGVGKNQEVATMPKYFTDCSECGRVFIPVCVENGKEVACIHWHYVNEDICKGSGAPVVEDAAPLAVAS